MTYKRFLKRKVILTDQNNAQWYGTVETYTLAAGSSSEMELGLMTEMGLMGFSINNINAILED
jgi:hypothetical protein